MTRPLVLAALFCALAACSKKKEQEAPPPPPAAAAPAAPAAPKAAFTKTDLGAVASTGTAAENDPRLAIDAKGRPVVAFKSAGKHYVRRHEAGAWTSVGDAVACKSELDTYALATDAEDAVLVAGTIMNTKGTHYALACVARETPEGWKVLGEPVGDEQAAATGIALAATASGPIVTLRQRSGEAEWLALWRFDGAAWRPVGDGRAPVTAGVAVPEFAAATLPDGLVLAWREKISGQPQRLVVQKLVAATSSWQSLPAVADVDGDTEVELAGAADGSVLLARTWNPGFKEVLRWAPGAAAWTSLGSPGKRDYTAHDPPVVMAGAKGEAVLAWAGERVEIARQDGAGWTDVARDLGRKPHTQSATRLATAPDGTVVVLWRDADTTTSEPARLFAASFAAAR